MVTRIFFVLTIASAIALSQNKTLITSTFTDLQDSANGYSVPPYSHKFTGSTENHDLRKFDSITVSITSLVTNPTNARFDCSYGNHPIFQSKQDTIATFTFTQSLFIFLQKANLPITFTVSNDSTTVYSLHNLTVIGWN